MCGKSQGGFFGTTADRAYVSPFSAVIIERVFKWDDVIGAVSIYDVCGLWGTLGVGFFIREDRLGDLTRADQIGIQSIGALGCFLWAFGVSLLLYVLVDKFLGGIRVSKEDEIMGLNVADKKLRI